MAVQTKLSREKPFVVFADFQKIVKVFSLESFVFTIVILSDDTYVASY